MKYAGCARKWKMEITIIVMHTSKEFLNYIHILSLFNFKVFELFIYLLFVESSDEGQFSKFFSCLSSSSRSGTSISKVLKSEGATVVLLLPTKRLLIPDPTGIGLLVVLVTTSSVVELKLLNPFSVEDDD